METMAVTATTTAGLTVIMTATTRTRVTARITTKRRGTTTIRDTNEPLRNAELPNPNSKIRTPNSQLSLNSLLRGIPDELVHLELKADIELVLENPVHDVAWVDFSEDW
jgi:hypothetical protein